MTPINTQKAEGTGNDQDQAPRTKQEDFARSARLHRRTDGDRVDDGAGTGGKLGHTARVELLKQFIFELFGPDSVVILGGIDHDPIRVVFLEQQQQQQQQQFSGGEQLELQQPGHEADPAADNDRGHDDRRYDGLVNDLLYCERLDLDVRGYDAHHRDYPDYRRKHFDDRDRRGRGTNDHHSLRGFV